MWGGVLLLHNFRQHPEWTIQFTLVLDRSTKCFLRSYQTQLLELCTIMVKKSFILSLPVFYKYPFKNIIHCTITNTLQNL